MAENQRNKHLTAVPRSEEERVPMKDLPRHWSRDWKRAYSILTRDDVTGERPVGRWARTRAFFDGIWDKLTPARGALLTLCVILVILDRDSDDNLLLVAFAGVVFLLVLELADRVKTRDELEVARQLQRDLLPSESPPLPGYEFAFSYQAANTIGGDYYNFVPLQDGRVALLVGDASGHGMAAGLLMAIADTTLHIGLEDDVEPLAVAAKVNRALVRTGGTRAFMTLFYGLLEPQTGRLDFVSAGHPFPLLRRASGELIRLGMGSYPLGVRENLRLATDSVELAASDLLVLYSDGIPEAVNKDGESFSYERLQHSVEPGGTAQAVHDRLLADLAEFEGDEPPLDDRSLVVIQRH